MNSGRHGTLAISPALPVLPASSYGSPRVGQAAQIPRRSATRAYSMKLFLASPTQWDNGSSILLRDTHNIHTYVSWKPFLKGPSKSTSKNANPQSGKMQKWTSGVFFCSCNLEFTLVHGKAGCCGQFPRWCCSRGCVTLLTLECGLGAVPAAQQQTPGSIDWINSSDLQSGTHSVQPLATIQSSTSPPCQPAAAVQQHRQRLTRS